MNIVLVGNCQTWPITELIANHCEDATVIGSIVVYRSTVDDEEKDLELLKKADVIVSQLITDTFAIEYIQTNNLKSLFPGKIVVIPNLFFHGQNPDLVYAYGSERHSVTGPTDVYHSQSILQSWNAGHELQSITFDNYISRNFSSDEMQQRVEKSFQDLENRESQVDVKMSDYLRDIWCDMKVFHTFNHPTIDPVRAMVGRISNLLDIKFVTNEEVNNQVVDRLGAIQPPMEASMFENLGMSYTRSQEIIGVPLGSDLAKDLTKPNLVYSFKEYVELCFRCYDKQAAKMETLSYTPS